MPPTNTDAEADAERAFVDAPPETVDQEEDADTAAAAATIRAAADAVDAAARARLVGEVGEGEGGDDDAPPPPPPLPPADPDAAAVASAIEAALREEVARAWEAADTARERVRERREREVGEEEQARTPASLFTPSSLSSLSFSLSLTGSGRPGRA